MITAVWPRKTGEQPQGAITAHTGRNGSVKERLTVEAYQRHLLVLAPAGVLLHHAGGGFKFRDVAATFAAGIWIVFHVVIPPCTTSIGARQVSLSTGNTPPKDVFPSIPWQASVPRRSGTESFPGPHSHDN